jgi:DNA-directed RNA polymerase specialized sigma24 family protein
MRSKEICRPRPAPEAASELGLTARAQRGEEAAFFALYELHKARVYAICLRLAGAATSAEELTRYVFLRVFRNIVVFERDAEFATALEEFAIRVAIAVRRQQALAQPLPACQGSAAEVAQAGPPRNGASQCQPDAGDGARREQSLLPQLLELDLGPSFGIRRQPPCDGEQDGQDCERA